MAKVMLTTKDNPYNPFVDFDSWLYYDESRGYFTNALLGRIVVYSDELSDVDKERAIETAIDEIITLDPTLNYKKIKKTE
jgi:hypothetical protein